jgi:hypothetical protein
MESDRKWYRAHAWSEVTEKALSGSYVIFSLNFSPVLFSRTFFPNQVVDAGLRKGVYNLIEIISNGPNR